MPEYRRANVPGSLYFFTVVTYKRKLILTSPFARKCLREAFTVTKKQFPFVVDAIVILPNHIHTIWKLPENDAQFSLRCSKVKSTFTKLYLKTPMSSITLSKSYIKKRERGVWQRRFWEHWIRDEEDYFNHLDYIHYNPVKHGYVQNVLDWKWSSFHRFVKKGWYDPVWGANVPDFSQEISYGEV